LVSPPNTGGATATVAWRRNSPPTPAVAGVTADTMGSAEPGSRAHHGARLPSSWADDALAQAGGIDELIDIEQQAEFFVLLGEELAAIDLLQAHLRQRGGAGPLPYLRLLEICRGRGDREAYELARRHLEERFGAPVPRWGTKAVGGRELQDYPKALAALQSAWPVPRDAMGELEKLLLHPPGSELLDLQAYLDVLMLYVVARDLDRRGVQEAEAVDVLLPLAQGRDACTTANRQMFAVGGQPAAGPHLVIDCHAAPVDLDLDQPAVMQGQLPGAASRPI
jgi:hypothetical protein